MIAAPGILQYVRAGEYGKRRFVDTAFAKAYREHANLAGAYPLPLVPGGRFCYERPEWFPRNRREVARPTPVTIAAWPRSPGAPNIDRTEFADRFRLARPDD